MPIDFAKSDPQGVLRFTVLRQWNFDGHEVVLVTLENIKTDYECKSDEVMCECDFADNRSLDAHKCPSKQRARDEVAAESRAKYGGQWKTMDLKDAILDVYGRVRKHKEYLGEYHPGTLYVHDVARILDRDLGELHPACRQLFVEEKLDFNGMILCDYESRFRFPQEIQQLFRYLVEEPLGWPNGEAGDCMLATIEAAINEHTDYKHGKQAFWEHNYPNIEPHLLIMFGTIWLETALVRLEADPKAKAEYLKWAKPSMTVKDLRQLARRFAQLGRDPKKSP